MSAKRESELGVSSERLRAFSAFAGATPAVPANHLIGEFQTDHTTLQ
jgi:hypothetical protein